MGLSRRLFLHRLGAAGGGGAAFAALNALGLAGAAAAADTVVAPTGEGRSVVILGAGVAGLVSAYELERAGFKVTVLEARDRVGGRNWTLRNGSKIEMVGEETQTVGFADDVYMNAGPARLPSHHQGVLSYCRKLGVPLEVEVNSSRSAYFWDQTGEGRPYQMRQGINDTRGHISELLAKAIRTGALDQDLTLEDKERLMPFLRHYGDLDEAMVFKGTERSGLLQAPGAAAQFARHRPPVPLRDLLGNRQLGATLFEDSISMQATMFQPVGGMDQIVVAFEKAITSPLIKNAEVTEIRMAERGVTVAYRNRLNGKIASVEADYAIVTLPLALLSRIDNNFGKPVKTAIASVPNDFSNKIGFESPRFWEREQIYGGISFVGGQTSLIWYPSNGLHSEIGMLLACYCSGPTAEAFAGLPLAQQVALARASVEKLHPGHSDELTKAAVVNWSKIPFNLGPWPKWDEAGGREGHFDSAEYRLLNEPHGRVYFSGAHLSQTPGWQEGAVFSAQRVIAHLSKRAGEQAMVEPVRPA